MPDEPPPLDPGEPEEPEQAGGAPRPIRGPERIPLGPPFMQPEGPPSEHAEEHEFIKQGIRDSQMRPELKDYLLKQPFSVLWDLMYKDDTALINLARTPYIWSPSYRAANPSGGSNTDYDMSGIDPYRESEYPLNLRPRVPDEEVRRQILQRRTANLRPPTAEQRHYLENPNPPEEMARGVWQYPLNPYENLHQSNVYRFPQRSTLDQLISRAIGDYYNSRPTLGGLARAGGASVGTGLGAGLTGLAGTWVNQNLPPNFQPNYLGVTP